MASKQYIIPIFVPHQGCPHDCIFCNQEEITGQTAGVSPVQIETKISSYLTTMPESAGVAVAFYGGSFTGLKSEQQEKLLEAAYPWLQAGEIDEIRISTRPDYIDSETISRLKDRGVKTVELGVQSLDSEVLKASKRGHSRQQVLAASQQLKEAGFKLGLQLMPGLPASSLASDLETGRRIVELEPDFVRIYPTLVFKGTELADLYQTDEYSPLGLEAAVKLSGQLLKLFRGAGIPVIRIGLQPSSGVSQERILAGPFHPAFRQLVESYLLREKIINRLESSGDRLVLEVHPQDSSVVRGQKNNNIIRLKDKYSFAEVIIETNQELLRGEVKILES